LSSQTVTKASAVNDRFKGGRCWNCGKAGHIAADCRGPRRESTGQTEQTHGSRMVTSTETSGTDNSDFSNKEARENRSGDSGPSGSESDNPLLYLLSDGSDSEDAVGVKEIRIPDRSSQPQTVGLVVGGVLMDGVVDSGSDITIIGKEMFKKVASVAKLRKKDFKSPDKQPRTYNLQPFRVHKRIEVDVSFGDHTMKTSIYVKMDAPEQLLLSEGVCRQLGIIRYHPDVKPGNATDKLSAVGNCKVPMVRVKLVRDIRLLPN